MLVNKKIEFSDLVADKNAAYQVNKDNLEYREKIVSSYQMFKQFNIDSSISRIVVSALLTLQIFYFGGFISSLIALVAVSIFLFTLVILLPIQFLNKQKVRKTVEESDWNEMINIVDRAGNELDYRIPRKYKPKSTKKESAKYDSMFSDDDMLSDINYNEMEGNIYNS